MREAVEVWLKCAVRETAKLAKACSPGCSDDELRESSGDPGFTSTTAQATSDRFTNPINPAESQPNGRDLPVARGDTPKWWCPRFAVYRAATTLIPNDRGYKKSTQSSFHPSAPVSPDTIREYHGTPYRSKLF